MMDSCRHLNYDSRPDFWLAKNCQILSQNCPANVGWRPPAKAGHAQAPSHQNVTLMESSHALSSTACVKRFCSCCSWHPAGAMRPKGRRRQPILWPTAGCSSLRTAPCRCRRPKPRSQMNTDSVRSGQLCFVPWCLGGEKTGLGCQNLLDTVREWAS